MQKNKTTRTPCAVIMYYANSNNKVQGIMNRYRYKYQGEGINGNRMGSIGYSRSVEKKKSK